MTATATQLLTAEEFAERYPNHRVELVAGEVEELPMPMQKHGLVNSKLDRSLGVFVEEHDLGWTTTCGSFVVVARNPDTVRGADFCYFSYNVIPKGQFPSGLIYDIPEFVGEVISPSNRWGAVQIKVKEYLKAGVKVVAVIDPEHFSATLHRNGELQQVLDNGDTLTIPDVFPGYAVKVKSLFAGLYSSEAPTGKAG